MKKMCFPSSSRFFPRCFTFRGQEKKNKGTNQDFISKNEIKEGWKTTFVRFLHKISYFLPYLGIPWTQVDHRW
jgi:hypothetical protein